ncbi:MAG: tetratricopeptide repeat protein [Phycisphaeraceae bacterium]|nr:tetratricopeptide repeat protein [Phycisphaeraceae bacterium]
MRIKSMRVCAGLIGVTLAVGLLAGCGGPSTKKQVLNGAELRWRQMRSNMALQMAQQQFDTGDLELAEKTVTSALAQDPKNPRLYVLAGRVCIERGQLERAYHFFEQSVDFDGKAPEPHYYQGIVLQRWQEYARAEAEYRRAFELEPDNVAYLLAMGEMRVADGRLDGALKLLEDRIVYFDQNASLRVAIGRIHQIAGRPVKAMEYFQKALILDPDNHGVAEDLALAQLDAGRFDEAAATLRQLTGLPEYKDRKDVGRLLAKAYLSVGRIEDAKAIYLQQRRSDPEDVEAWVGLGETSWASGDPSATLLAAERVMRLAPQRHEGYLMAGLALRKQGKFDQAAGMFEKAAKVQPDNIAPMLLWGAALEEAGRKDQAAKVYQRVLERDPNNERAKRLLAQVRE